MRNKRNRWINRVTPKFLQNKIKKRRRRKIWNRKDK